MARIGDATCFLLRTTGAVLSTLAVAVPLCAAADDPPPPPSPRVATPLPVASPRAAPSPAFDPVVISDQTPRYTGEPISLSLKDADIRDVLKTFAILTRLNIVVDPAVTGSVTVELHDVPWDQAFELILTLNGLGYQMLDRVLYVAPAATLARRPLYSP